MTKKTIFLFLALLTLAGSLQAVSLFLDYARFQTVEGQPYVEVYITVDGTTVEYRKRQDPDGFQAKVELSIQLLELREDGDTTVRFFDKYNLLSPVLADTQSQSMEMASFPDLKRINTPPGWYALRVIARDVYSDARTDHLTVIEVPEVNPEAFSYSDVEFIAGIQPSVNASVFTKHGKDIIPFGLEGTFINQDSLRFYVELYNTDKVFEGLYFAQASLYRGEEPLFQHSFTRRKAPAPMDILTGGFGIGDLPPSLGEPYSLRIRVFDKTHKDIPPLTERVYIYSEDMLTHQPVSSESMTAFSELSDEEVQFYIQTLTHVTDSEDEIRLAKNLRSPEERRNYLAGFWEKRAQAEEKPANTLWYTHKFAVQHANEQFESAFRKGWQTDRGRVFIKYGPPSDIERYPNDRGYLPYEIWKYDILGTQAQVVFIFVDQDRATNSYTLIHSTKYGELQNPTWRSDLLQPNATNMGRRLYDLREGSGTRVQYEADSRARTNIGGGN